MTPSGSCAILSSSVAPVSSNTLSGAHGRMYAVIEKKIDAARATPFNSLLDCAIGLPISRVSMRASSSRRSTISCAKAHQRAMRSRKRRRAPTPAVPRAPGANFSCDRCRGVVGDFAISEPSAGFRIFSIGGQLRRSLTRRACSARRQKFSRMGVRSSKRCRRPGAEIRDATARRKRSCARASASLRSCRRTRPRFDDEVASRAP